ncbi:MAG TPA: beta-ketoacyl-[acyl-carrier-protein] synthase II [Rhodospirillales bacterium]|nr:beta-ketoacyl-[acyl-carrier-protein] synthase II [Rhodospirillales bacterium]
MRRVVVTGIGLVTPLACGADLTWNRLIEGKSGLGPIKSFDATQLSSRIAGEVPRDKNLAGSFNNDDLISNKEKRRMDTFIQYGLVAADFAIADAGWIPVHDASRERTGVLIGSGIGGLPEIEKAATLVHGGNLRHLSPFFIPASLINLVSGHVAIKHGFKGPNHAVVTACSSGAHAIGDATRMIMWEDAEVMIAGGTEAAICKLGVHGFSQAKALSTAFNDTPEKASRPWDIDRDGFVIGEGAGIVVLEELEHAKNRNANIYAEVVGYGMSGDAHHITAPAEDGNGAYRSMQIALKRAALNPSDIDYINAHGTSTPLGDAIEVNAVKRLFGNSANDIAMSSTKSATGHLLGAAGAVEAIFSMLAIKHKIVPPTLNLDNPSVGCDLNLVPHKSQERRVRNVLSNSFGFGGTNASLVMSEFL